MPWDARSLQAGVRTLRHNSRQPRDLALRQLQEHVRQPQDIVREVDSGALILQDALGTVQQTLAEDLFTVQHFRLVWVPGFVVRLWSPADQHWSSPSTGHTSTSTTTTAIPVRTQCVALPFCRLVLMRGAWAYCIELNENHHLFDVALWFLIQRHAQDEPISTDARIIMTSALPPRSGRYQDVVCLLIEDVRRITIAWEDWERERSLVVRYLEPGSYTQLLLPSDATEAGWQIAVNGMPAVNMNRPVRHGDFIQVYSGQSSPAVAPAGWAFAHYPWSRPLAWQLHIGTSQVSLCRKLRERRLQMGFSLPREGFIMVHGPGHGDLVLNTGEHGTPTLEHARAVIRRLHWLPNGLDYEPAAMRQNGALALVSSQPNSHKNVILCLAPGYQGHFLVALAHPVQGYVPAVPVDPGVTLFSQWNLRAGDVLSSVRPEPPSPDSSAAVEQLSHTEADESTAEVNVAGQAAAADGANDLVSRGTSLAQLYHRRAPRRQVIFDKVPDESNALSNLIQECTTHPVRHADSLSGPSEPKNHGFGAFPEKTARQEGEIPNPSSFLGRSSRAESRAGKLAARQSIPTPFGRRHVPLPQVLSLEHSVPRPAAAPDGPSIRTGVSAEMFDFIFRPFSWDVLCQDWECVPHLQPAARQFLQGLRRLQPHQRPTALQIYVDGSFELAATGEVRSGWSLCILGLVEGEWMWVGFMAAPTGPGNAHSLSVAVHSAFETELSALVFALAWCVAQPIPAAIFYDSQSAGDVAGGSASVRDKTDLSSAAAALLHLLLMQRRAPAFCHVRAHKGQPLNEFCDGAAKAAARMQRCTQIPDTLYQAQIEEVLPWLWTSLGVSGELPGSCRDGVIQETAVSGSSGLCLSQVLPDNGHTVVGPVQLDMRLVTYNALSLASVAHRESVEDQLSCRQCCVVGLQEARQDLSGRADNDKFYVLSSAAQQGQLGVQAWFSKQVPLGRTKEAALYWGPKAFSVVEQSPRTLLVLARAGSLRFAVLVGHSPTSKETVEVRRQWWLNFTAILRRAPPSCVPLVFIDANAKAVSETAKNWEVSNDAFFRRFLSEHQLMHSGDADAEGRKFSSWCSPDGAEACIDFICYPREAAGGVSIEGPLPGFQGLLDHDHRPIAARCQWHQRSSLPKARGRLDLTALDSVEGRSRYASLLACMPPVPWSDNVDSHLAKIHQHVLRCLHSVCPPVQRKARNPITSERTWAFIHQRRELRRELHGACGNSKLMCLRACFSAWRSQGAASIVDDHLARMNAALIALQIKAHNRFIRDSAKQDAAALSRRLFQEARGQGPEALHRLFRQVTKFGRRYRKPCLAPAIQQSDGTFAEDSLSLLGDHFAAAERATAQSAASIKTGALSAPTEPLQAVPELSLPSLALAFGQLARRKASGLSGIPAEALSSAPVPAAHCFSSLLFKMQLRGQTPALWRGGKAVAIEKPSKPLHQLSAWRSILLLEAGAKGVARALRPCLLRSFEKIRQEGQGGSRPKMPIQLPMALCRGFLRRLKEDGVSGGIIFVDGASAFYSVLRQRLCGRESEHSAQYLEELASCLFEDEEDRLRFLCFWPIRALRSRFVDLLCRRLKPLGFLSATMIPGPTSPVQEPFQGPPWLTSPFK